MEQFFKILVQEHQNSLFCYALSLTGDAHAAEDLVQEAFLAVYRKIKTSDEEIKNFGAWLRATARNLAMTRWKKAKRMRFVLLGRVQEVLEGQFSEDDDPAHTVWQDRGEALKDCLRRLRKRARNVIGLYYTESLTAPQVAERLGERADSVRHALCRARNALRSCIDKRIEGGGGPQR